MVTPKSGETVKATVSMARWQLQKLQGLAKRERISISEMVRQALFGPLGDGGYVADLEGMAERLAGESADAWEHHYGVEAGTAMQPPGHALEEAEAEIGDFEGRKTVGGEPTDEFVVWQHEVYKRAWEIAQ